MMKQQYANHRRIDPLLVFFLAPLAGISLCSAVLTVFLHEHHGFVTLLLLTLSLQTLVLSVYVRMKALVAQDRAICAQEQLRHYVHTGALLDARLTRQQIIALRFASDEEFGALAKKAADEGMKPDAIKRAITQWRADDHRV
jgi:hypothetical protein